MQSLFYGVIVSVPCRWHSVGKRCECFGLLPPEGVFSRISPLTDLHQNVNYVTIIDDHIQATRFHATLPSSYAINVTQIMQLVYTRYTPLSG